MGKRYRRERNQIAATTRERDTEKKGVVEWPWVAFYYIKSEIHQEKYLKNRIRNTGQSTIFGTAGRFPSLLFYQGERVFIMLLPNFDVT